MCAFSSIVTRPRQPPQLLPGWIGPPFGSVAAVQTDTTLAQLRSEEIRNSGVPKPRISGEHSSTI